MERAARAGLAGIISKEYNRMVSFVRSKLADSGSRDAEDVVQDVVARLYETLDPNVPFEKLTSYLYASVRNRIVDMMRSRREHGSIDEEHPETGLLLSEVLASADRTDARLESEEFLAALHAAIGELGEDERDVVIATEFEEIPFQELSEEWGEPIGTLLSRKARAIEKIKKSLVKGGIGHA